MTQETEEIVDNYLRENWEHVSEEKRKLLVMAGFEAPQVTTDIEG